MIKKINKMKKKDAKVIKELLDLESFVILGSEESIPCGENPCEGHKSFIGVHDIDDYNLPHVLKIATKIAEDQLGEEDDDESEDDGKMSEKKILQIRKIAGDEFVIMGKFEDKKRGEGAYFAAGGFDDKEKALEFAAEVIIHEADHKKD